MFWEALGFRLDEGWGTGDRPDGILSPADGPGPYVFLRQVPPASTPVFDVVLATNDLDALAAADGVAVERPRHSSGWGPDLLLVRDPDDRVLTVREERS